MKILIIEPHPDDAVASSLSLLLNQKDSVEIVTVARTGDSRDKTTKSTFDRAFENNIQIVTKLDLPDYHWDERVTDLIFSETVRFYIENYDAICGEVKLETLRTELRELILRNPSVVFAVPVGFQHPFHVLVSAIFLEEYLRLQRRPDAIVWYQDHPYDLKSDGKKLLPQGSSFIEEKLRQPLYAHEVRFSLDLEHLVRQMYGEKFVGHFDGLLKEFTSIYHTTAKGEAYDAVRRSFGDI